MSRKPSNIEYIAIILGCIIFGLAIGTQIGHNISKKGVKMTEEKPKVTFCPNCQQPATRSGNEITCEKCDATFEIKRKEATVKKLGPYNELEQRVARLEAAHSPAEQETDEPKSDETEPEEEPIL